MKQNDVQKLTGALRAVVEASESRNLRPIQREYAVLWWEPYDAHGSTGKSALRKLEDFRSVADMLHGEPAMDRLHEVIDEIRKNEAIPYVVDKTAEIVFEVYLAKAMSVSCDETILEDVARRCVEEINNDTYLHRTVLQVEQFNAPEPFELTDDIVFRPITMDDIEEYGRETLPVRNSPRLNKRDWICTINQTLPRNDITDTQIVVDRLLGALGLTKEGRARISVIIYGPVSLYLGDRYPGSRFSNHSSPHGSAVEFTPEDVERFRHIFQRVNAICDKKEKNRFVALRRFRAASERNVVDDKIIDLVIALESLLIPQSGSEIGYRFRMRGAAFLPDTFGDIGHRMDLMKKLYNARSSAVHGSSSKNADVNWLMQRAT